MAVNALSLATPGATLVLKRSPHTQRFTVGQLGMWKRFADAVGIPPPDLNPDARSPGVVALCSVCAGFL